MKLNLVNVQIIETKLYSNLKRLWEAGHRSKCQLNVLTLLDVQMELWKSSTLHVDLKKQNNFYSDK